MSPVPSVPPLLPRAFHGGPGPQPFTGTDFSVNSNPYGPNPALLSAVRAAAHGTYPDPSYRDTRCALADWHGVEASQVALSVGASDLLHRAVRAFMLPGEKLVSLHAPFGELARAAQLQGAVTEVVTQCPANLPSGTRLVYVGQPHNPTGTRLPRDELRALAEVCRAAGAILLLDLAYAPFVGEDVLHLPAVLNLLSPGKAHGLVGARPAYAVAQGEVIARLDNLAPAWHVPAATEALLAALPLGQEFLHRTLPLVREEAAALAAALRLRGEVRHHGTPYLMLRLGGKAGGAPWTADTLAAALLARGCKVRDCTSYGFPDFVRISTQGAVQDARLLRALDELSGAPC